MAGVSRPQLWGRKFEQNLVVFLNGEDGGQSSTRPRQLEFGHENIRKEGATQAREDRQQGQTTRFRQTALSGLAEGYSLCACEKTTRGQGMNHQRVDKEMLGTQRDGSSLFL